MTNGLHEKKQVSPELYVVAVSDSDLFPIQEFCHEQVVRDDWWGAARSAPGWS